VYKTSLLLYYVVALESCIVSSSSAVVPLLCQFVEGWLLQVGPDSVFEVNEALWDIFFANAKMTMTKRIQGLEYCR